MPATYQLLSQLALMTLILSIGCALLAFGIPVLRLAVPYRRLISILFSTSVLVLIASVATLSILKSNYREAGRRKLRNELALLGPDFTVCIDGSAVGALTSRAIATSLSALGRIADHHSIPTAIANLTITSGDRTVRLLAAQDSEVKDEFWIYLPGAPIPPNRVGAREIGRVRSTELLAGWNLAGASLLNRKQASTKPAS